jgi:hypothetical protein
MSISWFKLHHELPDDIKLRRFSSQEKWAWIALLCMASKSSDRGVITADNEDIADYCEFSNTQDWLYFRDKLIAKGMLEISEFGLITVCNWQKRQNKYPSDTPEATRGRKARQRAKSKPVTDDDVTSESRDVTSESRHRLDQTRLDQNRSDQEKTRETTTNSNGARSPQEKTVVVSDEILFVQEKPTQEEKMPLTNYPPNSPEADQILKEVRQALELKQGKLTEPIRVLTLTTDPTKVRQAIAVLVEQQTFTKSPEAFFSAALKNGFAKKSAVNRSASVAIPPDFDVLERSLSQAIASRDFDFAIAKLGSLTAQGLQSMVDRLLELHPEWEEHLAGHEVFNHG